MHPDIATAFQSGTQPPACRQPVIQQSPLCTPQPGNMTNNYKMMYVYLYARFWGSNYWCSMCRIFAESLNF